MPTITVNGLTLFYQDTGQGEPLLLLSDFGLDHTFWVPLVGEVEDRYRCIVPDSRGVGQTDKPLESCSIAQMAQDMAALLDTLNLEAAHLVGLGMGGMIAQEMALLQPRRCLTMALVGTTAVLDGRTLALLEACKLMARRMARQEYLHAVTPWLFGPGAFQRPEIVQSFIAMNAETPWPQPEYALDRQVDAMAAFDFRPHLRDIRVPTEVIVGEYDILTPLHMARPLAESIRGSRLVIIPSAGHLLPREQLHAFIESLENLYKRVSQKSGR